MKSSTITLAVTLALSSSSSVSSMPHYLDSVADASLSARAPAYFVKRSLLESQSFDEEPNALLKRGNEKIKSSSLSSQNDNKDDNDDQAEDDDCEDDESSDSEDAVHDPTEQYYKIGSNSSTGVRIPKSSSTQSNSNKPPPAQAPALEEKKQDYQKSKTTEQPNYEKPETSKQPSYEKPETSKQWSQPPVDPVKVQKTYSHKESSSSQSSSYSSSHQHYGESGGKSPEPVGSHSGYSGKATLFVALDHDLDLDNSLSKIFAALLRMATQAPAAKPTKTVITSSPFKVECMVVGLFAARLSLLHAYRLMSAQDVHPRTVWTYQRAPSMHSGTHKRVFLISSGMSKNKPREEYRDDHQHQFYGDCELAL
ncbi:hypothetical protein PSHT_03422 [Puccinia striiformis]|uniref:Uncharacterized protein n=2 Tax=Puccinia striiformis TaxID=27350 RepID=A0A2S4WFT5_9BASI|nr:hypothetical protein PSHT_03422 [Puccinia striiformis]